MSLAAALEDLRLLRLAELYEVAYEQFLLDVADREVRDPEVRAALLKLAGPDDHRARIVREMDRIRASLPEQQRAAAVVGTVQDVVDCERAARRFYLERLDAVHDPAVAKLFRDLFQEETRHVAWAEEAFDLARQHADVRPDETSPLERDENGEILLREGVSDFGPTP